ncbi:MAG: Ig-like domain-containing protein, partial [Acidimicrobiales bacterium]|nr:Ig-like domain-containing protein [Acidimicrobiales bacterium]
MKEFDGWTFMDPVSWNATAGQERDQFTKGKGVIAVADSDEYDDNAGAKFDAWLSTPEIDITGAAAGSLVLSYDSSWRQEPQHGAVTVSFDGGEEVALLELTPDTATAYNETVELNLNNPAGAKRVVISWDHQGYNNWWWAIDNVEVYGGAEENTAPVVAGQSVEVKEDGTVSITLTGNDEDGDDLSFAVLSQPGNGTLSGTAPALS